MQSEKRQLKLADILENYPDCPQRDMALRMFRKGKHDLAQAWIDALEELQQEGNEALFGKPLSNTG